MARKFVTLSDATLPDGRVFASVAQVFGSDGEGRVPAPDNVEAGDLVVGETFLKRAAVMTPPATPVEEG